MKTKATHDSGPSPVHARAKGRQGRLVSAVTSFLGSCLLLLLTQGPAIAMVAGFVISLAMPAEAASPASTDTNLPSAQALLDRYAESQQIFRSFLLKFEMTQRAMQPAAKGARPTTDAGEIVELRYDGRRAKLIKTKWSFVDAALTNLPKEKAKSQFWMWDGKAFYGYVPNYLPGRAPRLQQMVGKSEAEGQAECQWMSAQNFVRYEHLHLPCDSRHDRDFLERALRRAKRVSVRPAREKIGDSLCYVIEAEMDPVKHSRLVGKGQVGDAQINNEWVARARHTIWLDPDHGYHIAKALSVYSKPLAGKVFVLRLTRENVRFARMDGVWLPVQMDDTRDEAGTPGPSKTTTHYKVISFARNPDHEARGSFQFDDVADGSLVQVFEKGQLIRQGSWQNGKMAP